MEHQGLALHVEEAQVQVIGQPFHRVAVDPGVFDLFQHGLGQSVPHLGEPHYLTGHLCPGKLCRFGQAHDAGDVLRARPDALLVAAALRDGLDLGAFSDVDGAYPFRAVEFVGRYGEQVHVKVVHVCGYLAHRLDGVGMEGDVPVPGDRPCLGHGLDGADLVVGVHHGDEDGVFAYGRFQVFYPDDPLSGDREAGDLEAPGLQVAAGF